MGVTLRENSETGSSEGALTDVQLHPNESSLIIIDLSALAPQIFSLKEKFRPPRLLEKSAELTGILRASERFMEALPF